MKVAINGVNRLTTNDMLEQLLEVIIHTFDFCKKFSNNMELLQSNEAQMAMYRIVIGIPQLTLTLLANIEAATKSNYGCKFCLAVHAICKKYTYNHVHNATSLQTLKDAPAPNAGTEHSIANSVSFLKR